MEKNKSWYGEWVIFNENDPEDKEDARKYLILWKKFYLRKVSTKPFDEISFEQIIEKSSKDYGQNGKATLGIKFCIENKIQDSSSNNLD